MATNTRKPIVGKGGNFDTRKNPFTQAGNNSPGPALAGVPGLGSVLDLVLQGGAALMVGMTRDHGAVVITIFDGEDRHRTYCSNERELENAFASILAAYEV